MQRGGGGGMGNANASLEQQHHLPFMSSSFSRVQQYQQPQSARAYYDQRQVGGYFLI